MGITGVAIYGRPVRNSNVFLLKRHDCVKLESVLRRACTSCNEKGASRGMHAGSLFPIMEVGHGHGHVCDIPDIECVES